MDGKTWLWRKRSSEKTIVAANVPGMSANCLHEETEKIQKGAEAERPLPGRSLNEKLASVLLECHAKGDLATIEEELAEESSAGEATEETEADCLRRRLNEALRQCEQRMTTLQKEQEQIAKDALMKASRDFLTAREVLEEKLKETSKRLTDVVVENTNLSKAHLIKERLIDELHKHISQKAAESNVLMVRLEASEKENAFLKYEMHIIEKELEVRDEELEYHRHSIDASHWQHAENVQRISMLEAECQRLQSLTRKRLPGPASFMKTRSEVADSQRKVNPVRDLILRDTTIDKSPAIPPEDTSFYLEQLRTMEEDNSILKGLLHKKNSQLQSTRTMYSLTASRLSQVEAQIVKISRSDEGVCSAGSWANALITDSRHYKDEKLKSSLIHKTSRPSEMSLMDDFVEVERLAMVSFQAPGAGSGKHLRADKELVPVVKGQSGGIRENVEIQCTSATNEVPFDWLQVVLKAISKQQNISKRSLPELIQDIKIAVGCIDQVNSRLSSSRYQEENRRLKDELKNQESAKTDAEVRLQSATERTDALAMQLEESERRILSLQVELESLKQSKGMIEDQMENQKSINEDLDTQLTIAKAKLNDVLQKFASLEVELEDKGHCCEELEATCLDLQLELESTVKKEALTYDSINNGNQTRHGWELVAAPAKLADSGETAIDFGRQLKAVASPATRRTSFTKRFSLHDQMVAEDNAKAIILRSPREDASQISSFRHTNSSRLVFVQTPYAYFGSKNQQSDGLAGALTIVPSKRQGYGLFRKLMMRKKKGSSKKTPPLVKA